MLIKNVISSISPSGYNLVMNVQRGLYDAQKVAEVLCKDRSWPRDSSALTQGFTQG